jgi:uncharacterized membrane protein
MKLPRRHYTYLTIFNLLAIPITAFLIYLHFKPELSTVCSFGSKWDCDIINKSIYSTFLGIPVAIMGLVSYLILLTYSIRGLFRDQRKLVPYATLFVAAGTLFALYLTGVEFFILKTFCLFCVMQQVIILAELGIMIHLWTLTKKS